MPVQAGEYTPKYSYHPSIVIDRVSVSLIDSSTNSSSSKTRLDISGISGIPDSRKSCNKAILSDVPLPQDDVLLKPKVLASSSTTSLNSTNLRVTSKRTITVLISFSKLSKYDSDWLRVGSQLLLLNKNVHEDRGAGSSTDKNKERRYTAALICFQREITEHKDNYVAYYYSGICCCLLGQYEKAVEQFNLSLRYNEEEDAALLCTLSEMISIAEGIRLATNRSIDKASMQQFFCRLEKLERKIIRRLDTCRIRGEKKEDKEKKEKMRVNNNSYNASTNSSWIKVNNHPHSKQQWRQYFDLGLYWYEREEGDHKALMYLSKSVALNASNEVAHYYLGTILQKQGRYLESLNSYKKAIELKPDDDFYYYMASQIYMQLEESKKALEMIDTAIALSPSDIAYKNMKDQILHAFGIERDLVDIALEK